MIKPERTCLSSPRHQLIVLYLNRESIVYYGTTENLYKLKLTCGYRRPTSKRDLLCRANLSCQPGDDLADNHHTTTDPIQGPNLTTTTEVTPTNSRRNIRDFFCLTLGISTNRTDIPRTMSLQSLDNTLRKTFKRGFKFCSTKQLERAPSPVMLHRPNTIP